jgi:hypothetical protein
LEGNPLENWQNVRRIRVRFKQGVEMQRAHRISGPSAFWQEFAGWLVK